MKPIIDTSKLLNREEINLDEELISQTLNGKTILITGAGGSIGSEISRQVLKFGPSKLILLGHGENSIYEIECELQDAKTDGNIQIEIEIADVRDRTNILRIMEKYMPDVVFHAAAHKHVPLMEKFPTEAIKNNVYGTLNVAEAAAIFGVETFVMISTDKAVNPTSVMGTTKRIAEMIIQGLDKKCETKFVAVRFGNVLGSRGSVVPRFLTQIEQGGPVTVTHKNMTRYFMTIPEASRLVLQACAFAQGGEIFILDMGEQVKIVDLAKKLIFMTGHSLNEIPIVYTGLRPGEKMYEELLMDPKNLDATSHEKIFVEKPTNINFDELISKIKELAGFLYSDDDLRKKISEIVPTYKMPKNKKKVGSK